MYNFKLILLCWEKKKILSELEIQWKERKILEYRVLSDNVKYYRFKNGYTQEELAEKCDLSSKCLSNIENSKWNMSIDI